MTRIGQSAGQGSVAQPVVQLGADRHRAQWNIARVYPFCCGYYVRLYAPVVHRKPFSCASKARHDLIADQQDTMLGAGFSDRLQIAIRRNDDPVGAYDCFQNNGCNGVRVFIHQNFFKMRTALRDRAVCRVCVAGWQPVNIRVQHSDHSGHVGACQMVTRITSETEGSTCCAVIAAVARDNFRPSRKMACQPYGGFIGR